MSTSDELHRIAELLDPMRGVRGALYPHAEVVASLRQEQHLRELALPHEWLLHRAGRTAFDDWFQDLHSAVDAMRSAIPAIDALAALKDPVGAGATTRYEQTLAQAMALPTFTAPWADMEQLGHQFAPSAVTTAFTDWARLPFADRAPSTADVDQQLETLAAAVNAVLAARSQGKSGWTWEQWAIIVTFVVPLILQFVMAWQQGQDLAAMEQRITDAGHAGTKHIDQRLDVLHRTIDELAKARPAPAGPEYVVVVDTLRVRARPDGAEVARARMNQVIEKTGENGKWLRVRYVDHVDARLVEGWCRKKHLRALDR